MNSEEKLMNILVDELTKSIDAEIIRDIMNMSNNKNRKKSIKKIFKL